MPMATPELASKFEDDGAAWKILEPLGWTDQYGLLIPPRKNYFPIPDGQEADALDYLCDEWDYGILTDEAREIVAKAT